MLLAASERASCRRVIFIWFFSVALFPLAVTQFGRFAALLIRPWVNRVTSIVNRFTCPESIQSHIEDACQGQKMDPKK